MILEPGKINGELRYFGSHWSRVFGKKKKVIHTFIHILHTAQTIQLYYDYINNTLIDLYDISIVDLVGD